MLTLWEVDEGVKVVVAAHGLAVDVTVALPPWHHGSNQVVYSMVRIADDLLYNWSGDVALCAWVHGHGMNL